MSDPTGSDLAVMDPLHPAPNLLLPNPVERSRSLSPAPSYRSKFSAPELEGGMLENISQFRSVEPELPDSQSQTNLLEPKQEGRPSLKSRLLGHTRSPSQTPFIPTQKFEFEGPPRRPLTGSRWVGIARLVLRSVVLIGSPIVVGLLGHSLHRYHATRNIKFSGIDNSWPERIDLGLVHFLLAVAVLALITSISSLLQGLRKELTASVSKWDLLSIFFSVFILVLWVPSTTLFGKSDRAGKNSLWWNACQRRHSPGNRLVGYETICEEQAAAYGLGVTLAVVEALVLFTWIGTAYGSRKNR